MTERTEELGLAGRLPISVGGEPIELRTLSLDESDKWLALLKPIDLETEISTELMLSLVVAYDVDHVLGGDLRTRMTKRELNDAVDQMVSAEDPFEEASRSVVAASGLLANIPTGLMYHLVNQSRRASITSSSSTNTASTPSPSARPIRKNGSSSRGRMASGGSHASAMS